MESTKLLKSSGKVLSSTLMQPSTEIFEKIIDIVRRVQGRPEGFIPLHEPRFYGNERKYVNDAIESTFISSVGEYVNRLEEMITDLTGAGFAVATVNGTSALHTALLVAGVRQNDEVLTQPLTFVATANAITYTGAHPVFVDVDRDTMGLSPEKLSSFLKLHSKFGIDGYSYNKITGRRISACVPMHTYGFPTRIGELREICDAYNITLIEDAAESLGSTYQGKQTGTFGKMGIFSFNGNKIVTSGGGGVIITDDKTLAEKAKHLTTTGKKSHRWEYDHDVIAYNYRMPNLNAALLCAQLENLDDYLRDKRSIAKSYEDFLRDDISFVTETAGSKANYWLNTILFEDKAQRDAFLNFSYEHEVMTRPAWNLMHRLEMFEHCCKNNLDNAEWLADRIVNLPSSVRI